MTRTNPRSATAGFTLLEVMIALAIIGIALISCLTLANRCLFSHEQVQRITTATMLGQYKMSELEGQARNGELEISKQQGVWEEPYSYYNWLVEYQDTPVSGVHQVTVTIRWGKAERNEEVTLDSFLFN